MILVIHFVALVVHEPHILIYYKVINIVVYLTYVTFYTIPITAVHRRNYTTRW